jgi:hypothetical protein
MPEWWPIQLFAGDVTQPNSLVYAIGHVRYEPLYYDDPPRYEVVPGLNGSRVFLEDCVLQVYDLETQTFNEYALGNLCDYGIILPSGDGARLYRELNPDRATPATLVRFNPSTGEREDLLTGEIEWLESVSPNGRYAVLVMDSNGQIEGLPNGIGADPQFERVMTPYLVLYDLAAQRIVYKTSTEWNQYPWEMAVRRLHESTLDVTDRGRFIHGDLGPTSRLVWLRDDVFWLRRLMSSEGGVDVFEDTVLHLADGQVIEKPIGEVVAVFSNRERLLVRANDGRTSSAVNMYDVETGEMSQFINGMDQYIVQIEVTKDDRIAVDIRLREQSPDRTILSAHYERILGR